MSPEKFDIRFHEEAEKEYNRLDNSVLGMVNKAIDELAYRADEVGKPLGNNQRINTKLAGCKEIKLREAGIRIVFRLTSEVVEVLKVVYILTIERRSDDFVFKLADKRYKVLKTMSPAERKQRLRMLRKWPDPNSKRKD